MARRGLGSDDDTVARVSCYFTGLFSSGLDDIKPFSSEDAALKFAKKCTKDGKGSNAHAVITYSDARPHTVVTRTRTGRLQVKKGRF